ncbi:uncharacterized protein LOC111346051 isoform X2 [Stylophora pistillata]|uniref:uncharacterized protein LOC111346051 isoform X1 n=1 Tax=Stylophora pistillata TaxID=50429 RepID=UPI000C039403|nr:uncharacterized protein LOC111346051 isoform X1 [Stylophora pistillata]XP_022809075.1 uncharacterized protein LOC111346051 isoform X2 [Stylophora pistillata]
MRSAKLSTCSLTRIVVLVLYVTTLQTYSSLATLNAEGVEKYVITRRGRYDTDVFKVVYKTGFECPSNVCANASAWVESSTQCSCSCKPETPTFLPKLGSCGDAVNIKKSLFGNCSQALGMESQRISDSQLSSSRHFLDFSPSKGRLNSDKAWYTRGSGKCFEIDLQEVRHVLAIATQGYQGTFKNYVKTFEIKYSYDGVKWTNYRNENNGKKFSGNSDTDTVKYNYFRGTFETRFLRIFPKEYNTRGYRCLRVEVYGCSDNTVCSRFFEWDFFLKSLNLANKGQVNIPPDDSYQSCQVVPGSAAYYNYQLENKWVGINADIFSVDEEQGNQVFKWADTTHKNHLGRIVRVKVTCNYSASASRPAKTACLIFKTSGKITLMLGTVPKTTPYISPKISVTVSTEPTEPSKTSLVTEPFGNSGNKDARTNENNSGSGVLIGVAVACAVVFAIALIVLVVFCKRRRSKNSQQGTPSSVRTTAGKHFTSFSDQESQPTYQDVVKDSEPRYGGAIYSAPEVNRYENRAHQSLDENVLQTPGHHTLNRGQHPTGQLTRAATEQSSAVTEAVYNVLEKPDISQENDQGSLYSVLERPPTFRSCQVPQVENPVYNVLEGPNPKQDQQEPLYNVLDNGPDTNGGAFEDGVNDEYSYDVLERPGPKQHQQEPLYNVLDNGPGADGGSFKDGANNENLYNVLERPDSGAGPNSGEEEYAAPREPLSPGGRNNPSYEQTLGFDVSYDRSRSGNGTVYEALRGGDGDDMYQPLKVT